MTNFDLVVIGGGAAGFFGAIEAASANPGFRVLILEKTTKVLSKVKVSGGGRCNVTHYCFDATKLSQHYPRGEKSLKQLFKKFQAQDVVEWFAARGVELHAEADGRMFPVSNSSQTIIDCFLREALQRNIKMELSSEVVQVKQMEGGLEVVTGNGKSFHTKNVLLATGGNANNQFYQWIRNLGHTIPAPIPSLFTFNDSSKSFTDLMGVAVPDAEVRIATTKFFQRGPVLITHWGLSGPAVIKLSAWAAQYLHEVDYTFTAVVNWTGIGKEDDVRNNLKTFQQQHRLKKVIANPLYNLPQRLWQKICSLSEIEETLIWAELPHKKMNRLLEYMIRCAFPIKGKTTFKEEFVTCGGVALNEIDLTTMQSKTVNGLYLAGEVLNIDGETGGFNFQAAWTTAYVAAHNMK